MQPPCALRPAAWLLVCMLPMSATAHHSFAAAFEIGTVIELEGEVTEVRWVNPHVEFDIRERDGSAAEIWTVESDSLPGLRARNIHAAFVAPGDIVKVAGNPARRGKRNVYLTNILLPGGEEMVTRNAEPRFSTRVVETSSTRDITEGDPSRPELGLFRVWTTPSASPFPFPEDANPALAHTNFPLTAAARAVLEGFDLIEDSPIRDCALKGMPTIMEQPYPMEIREADGNILLHMEEYDLVRTIFMDPQATPEPQPSILGHSVGRRRGNTLEVTTTHLNWGWYDTVGIPLSENAVLLEAFTLAEDGSRLDWRMTVRDEATFTEPVVLEKYWLWVPGVEVRRFECDPNQKSAEGN